jgi:hypothetical protein
MKTGLGLLALSLSVACGRDSGRAVQDSTSAVARPVAVKRDSLPASSEDACANKLPPNLIDQLKARFPHHRVPVSSDNEAWAVESDRRSGGDGCLGIAKGDFDGDGTIDFAVLLSPSGDTTSPLIVARGDSQAYRLDSLDVSTGPRRIYYVSALVPGRYQRTEILSDDSVALEPGELAVFESKRPGIVTGALEDGAVAYFYNGQRWVHVWLSD